MNKKLVVGIAGTLLAGKGIVTSILESRGFRHVSIRDLIKEELEKQGISPTRTALMDIGNDMRKKHGTHFWMQRALEKYSHDSFPLIIESIRNPAEIDYLRKNSRFFLIGVDAPFEVRWERARKRNMDRDKTDCDTFAQDDARDKGLGEPANGQQTSMCLVQADFLIHNDEEFSKLEDSKIYHDVIDIYEQIMK